MKQIFKRVIGGALLAAALTGCGGAGAGGGGASQPTTVTVKLSTVAQAGGNPQIKGVALQLLLPAGVTLKTVAGTRQTADGVTRYSGAAPFANLTSQLLPRPLFGNYSASATGRNAVTISFFGPVAFGPGEFASLVCTVPAGVSVTSGDFQVLDFHATGDSATALADDLSALFAAPTVVVVR
jgi:hypothetical protein